MLECCIRSPLTHTRGVHYHNQIKLELTRKVDLGPFKQKVDDGLPLRKASFTCIDTMLTTMPELVDVDLFLPHLQSGLAEKEVDVKLLCHQILLKLCRHFPVQIVASIDMLVEPLNKQIRRKAKRDGVGTEEQRAKQVIASALRALDGVSQLPDVDQSKSFQELMQCIKGSEMLNEMLDLIRKERN